MLRCEFPGGALNVFFGAWLGFHLQHSARIVFLALGPSSFSDAWPDLNCFSVVGPGPTLKMKLWTKALKKTDRIVEKNKKQKSFGKTSQQSFQIPAKFRACDPRQKHLYWYWYGPYTCLRLKLGNFTCFQ